MSFAVSSSSSAMVGAARSHYAGARLNNNNNARRGAVATPSWGSSKSSHAHSRTRLTVTAAMRPYTVRKGDSLKTIASKRGMSVEEIRKCNAGRVMDEEVKVGETILLPAGKLSKRDGEIIDGITKINEPRIYPTRKGETIMDIISARNISFEAWDDVKKLNPGVNLGTFQNGEKLKLPPGKYTVREKEMLQGCGILPAETVNPFKVLVHPNSLIVLAGVSLSGVYAMYFAACKRYQDHGIKLWGNDKPEVFDEAE